MQNSLTCIILTKNNENEIVNSIESALFADEVLIIDDESEDRTVEIVNSLKNPRVRIISHPLANDFSAQRNFALEKTTSDWALFLDVDEEVSDKLKREIRTLTQNGKYDGFLIKREDLLWGKKLKYGETGNIKLLRLGRVGRGKWEGMVHEEWKIDGKIGLLENPLLHEPHTSVGEFIREINFYSSIRARELQKKGTNANAILIIAYPVVKFVLNYFVRKGYKDGIRGLILAIIMSLHSFLVRAKLFLMQSKNEKK